MGLGKPEYWFLPVLYRQQIWGHLDLYKLSVNAIGPWTVVNEHVMIAQRQ